MKIKRFYQIIFVLILAGTAWFDVHAAKVSGSYFVNPSFYSPTTTNPITLTGCTNQSPISVTVPSAPQCAIPASGVAISQGNQGCCLGGSSSTCQTLVNGSTIIVNGGFSAGGGTCTGGGGGGSGGRTITITNSTATNPLPVFMGVNGGTQGLQNLNTCYTISSTPACAFNLANPEICQFTGGVSSSTPLVVIFTPISGAPAACTSSTQGQISVAFSAGFQPWGSSETSLAEFTLNGIVGGIPQDTIDVSLVAGFNKTGPGQLVDITGTSNNFAIKMSQAAGPSYNNVAGIYPLGCDECAASVSPPNPPGVQPQSYCQQGTQYNPNPVCQITRPQVTDSYTVTFSDIPKG